MTLKSEIGKYGEDLACEYLVNNKYRIIERNYKKPWGEIDIIAKDPDKTLVFVEVKTLQQSANFGLKPEDHMTRAKLVKLSRTASIYANNNQKLIKEAKGWRIDLVAITLDNADNPTISHYKNMAI